MKKEIIKAGICFVGIIILTFFSFACVYGQSADRTDPTWLNSYSDYLRLTNVQNEAILGIQDKFIRETASTQKELNSGFLALQTILNKPIVDDAAIIAKRNEIIAIQNKLQEKAFKYGLEIKTILTPEQVALLPPGCVMGFIFGRCFGRGVGIGRGFRGVMGRYYGYGMGGGFGRGMDRGFYRGIGWSYGRGRGRGFGRGR